MGKDCDVLVPEDFLCSVLSKPELRDRYSQLAFYDYVKVCCYSFKIHVQQGREKTVTLISLRAFPFLKLFFNLQNLSLS